jgi:hypothetical protein
MNKTFTVILEEDPETKDLIMPLPEGMCDELGWEIGDSLDWSPSPDGSFLLSKKRTQWVLVECVNTFRQRYMVEVPVGIDDQGKDKTLWALDTVTMGEAKEFSQEHIGEQIVSHRVVRKKEALELSDIDNDYTIAWNEETKLKTFFTSLAEQENGNT